MNKKYITLFCISIVLAGIFSSFASSSPDGLEKVAVDKGFITRALEYPLQVFMPDYEMPVFENGYLAVAFAGIVGTALVFLFVYFTIRPLAIKK
jgi:cobalt/nickel transport protein